MTPPSTRPGTAATLVGLLVGGGFLAAFLRDQDWAGIAAAVSRTRPAGLAAALGLLFAQYAVKTWRWALLLPAPAPSWGARWRAIGLGFGANVVLPGRVGEGVRVVAIHRRGGLPLGHALSGVFLERLFDLAALGFLLGLGGAALGVSDGAIASLRQAGGAVAVAALGAPLGLAWVVGDPARRARLGGALRRRLPAAWGGGVAAFVDALAAGMGVLGSLGGVFRVFAVSVGHWGLSVLAAYAVSWSLGAPIPLAAAAVVLGAVAFASALPQAPGFIGPFHWAVAEVLRLLGRPAEQAAAFAILYWIAGVVPPLVLGAAALAAPAAPERTADPAAPPPARRDR